MHRLPVVVALVLLAGAAGPAAQVVRPGIIMPPRDGAGGAAATGTARIRGRVVTADGGAPLRRAQVTIVAPEASVRRMTTTDADGRYEFAQLPAGRYTITAGKGGYVSLQVGQRRPFEPGTPVSLADGQMLNNVDAALPRGSVIAGRVSDEFGEPLAGVMVQAMRYQYMPGGRRDLGFSSAPFIQTDDLGQFRIYGLMPGSYVVSASMRQTNMMLGAGAVVADNAEGYPPTYYPNTTNPAEAQAVIVGVAQETSVAITLQAARMARVSGTVVDSEGRPAAGSMVGLRSGTGAAMMGMMMNGQVGADGSFTIANVPPGEHTVEVRPRPRGPDTPPELGSAPVTVAGDDITGVRITMTRGGSIRGRVVFEGTSPRTFAFGPLRFFPQSVDGDPGGMFFAMNAEDGTVNDDGTFAIGGVNGRVLLRAALGGNWTLKSITVDGDDITDEPLDMRNGRTVEDVRVVLTDKLTEVTGSVTGERGQALQDYVVVALPDVQPEGTAAVRYMRTARPDQEGRYRVRGLPPGRYFVSVFDSLEQGEEWDPELQRRVRDSGRAVTLAEGQSLALDLKLATGR